jgi:hypothetical protein
MTNFLKVCLAVSATVAVCSTIALADTVAATDVIFAAGSQSGLLTTLPGGGGTAPDAITLPAGATSITFSVTGTIILNVGTGNSVNDPDGVGAAVSSSSSTGFESMSGITIPNAGALLGVFIGSAGPSGTAPASLDYTTLGTNLTSYSPLIDQTFFIGDGLTGDGTGTTQTFFIPAGATQLYLGISDACGYNGAPSCYEDNSGQFNVSFDVTGGVGAPSVPEPASILLLATGAGGGLMRLVRRRLVRISR